jgi:exocyst complex component 1
MVPVAPMEQTKQRSLRMRSGELLTAVSPRKTPTDLVCDLRPDVYSPQLMVLMLTYLSFAVVESYITHIRILEDGAYQSSPPPPNASTDQKKPRVIIVAVRKSGRVRMHKARENGNGSFSIGKTWPLDDLTAVESFNGSTPNSPEEELRKQWAGGVGFIATIGKPYYWQANTPKEKQFFIGSLIKIYMKYTGGKSPELIGFDDQEKEQLLGKTSVQPRPQALNKPAQPSSTLATSPSNTVRNAEGRPAPPRQATESREPQARADVNAPLHPKDLAPRQRSGPDQKPHYKTATTPNVTRPPTSSSRMQLPREDSETESAATLATGQQQTPQILRKLTADGLNQESSPGRDDGGLPPRSRGGLNGTANAPGRFPDQIGTPVSQRTLTPDNVGGSRQATPLDAIPVTSPGNPPPERRRPPLQVSSERSLSHENSSDNMVPAPLATPSSQREFVRLPARSTDRPEAPQPLRVNTPSSTNFGTQGDQPETATMKSPNATKDVNITESTQPDQTIEDSSQLPINVQTAKVPKEPLENERPGLGLMIKKKSRADVASAFRKAASAASVANAFKPRVGGAAERLREQQAKSPEGPDGITGVVPAPSQMRSVSNDSSRRKPSDQLVSEEAIPPIAEGPLPEVKITVASSDKIDAEQTLPKSIPKQATPQKKPRDIKRPKPTSEETQKQLLSLGIESTILDDRGVNFATLLDDFGWMGDGIHSKGIDQMNDEIDRELNQAQIGGWLSRFEEEDDRIDAIRRGLDVSIAECEELDGLLTLYGVELGVGASTFYGDLFADSFRR